MIRRVTLLVVMIIPLLMLVEAAPGRDVEDITVTEGQTVTKDYGQIVANEPPVSPVFGTTARVPSQCRNAAYCDAIDLTITVPSSYQGEDFFRIDITLSWQPPAPNDLNLYLHRPEPSQYRTHTSATANNPEKISVPDPRDRKLVIIVSNFSGPNTGYRLSVAFVPLGRASFPEPGDEPSASRREQSRPSPPGGSTSAGFGDLPVVPQPDGGLSAGGQRPVEKPGADGPAQPMALLTLPATRNVPQNSRLPLIVTASVATLAVIVLGFILYRRGRQES